MKTITDIIARLNTALATQTKPIALHEPLFVGNEWHYVKECLDTGWVSSVGKYVDRFEYDLRQFTGSQYAIATVNGTAALHVCFQLAGVMPQDEVLVPTLTFVGTTNAIAYCGAIPHFIDTALPHLGIDANVLDAYLNEITRQEHGLCINRQTNRIIRGLCVMHTLGHPVDLDACAALCEKYHLVMIEDAAEALGSYYKGVHVGHRGLVGALSFNGNKIITTGGGGAILTNDAVLAKRAKHMTTTAKLAHPWLFQHDEIGFNYRLPNVNAAIGCAQLEKIVDYLAAKRRLVEVYRRAFAEFPGVTLLVEPAFAKSNYWLQAILLDTALAIDRDELLKALVIEGIMVRPLWDLQHSLAMYRECPKMPLPNAIAVSQRLIKIPSSPQLLG